MSPYENCHIKLAKLANETFFSPKQAPNESKCNAMHCLFALKVLSKLSLFISFFSFFKTCLLLWSFLLSCHFYFPCTFSFPFLLFFPSPCQVLPEGSERWGKPNGQKNPSKEEEEEKQGWEGWGVGWCWCDAMSHTLLVSPLKMINVGATRKHMCVSTCPALDFTRSKHTHSPCGATRERLILGSTGKAPELQKMEGGLERENGRTITRK